MDRNSRKKKKKNYVTSNENSSICHGRRGGISIGSNVANTAGC